MKHAVGAERILKHRTKKRVFVVVESDGCG
jgi:hypothetical protein